MKPKALLIAEKPSACQEFKNAYMKIKDSFPYDVDFVACAGHLIGLCEPDEYTQEWGKPWKKEVLPMIPSEWKYKVINPHVYSSVKSAWSSKRYDIVINAGDAGKEGQLIQMLVYRFLGVNVPILRLWTDDNTEKSIIKALQNLKPNEEYDNLTQSAYLRLFADWLVGMNFSRAASLALDRSSAVGRVMTSTLGMIVAREKEIKSFVPLPYFELEAIFTKTDATVYKAKLVNPEEYEKKPSPYAYLSNMELAKITQDLSDVTSATVVDVNQKDTESAAPHLMNLTDLQKECSRKYGYTPEKTLDYTQSLYDKKYVSYPRTESRFITTEKAEEIPELLKQLYNYGETKSFAEKILRNPDNIANVLKSKKYVDNKKVCDHPALLPTGVIPKDLSEQERNVYNLIIKRLFALFLPVCITSTITILTEMQKGGNSYTYKSSDTVMLCLGWKELYAKDSDFEKIGESSRLENISKGDVVSYTETSLKEKETTPPARYNEASLLTAMETAGKKLTDEELVKIMNEVSGLGTPATRAEIIAKLFRCDYITKKGKTIYPTQQGFDLCTALSGHSITSPELTALWEQKLKAVEQGTVTFDAFYKAIKNYVTDETNSLLKMAPIGPYRNVIGKCPKCNRDFLALSKSYACEGVLNKHEDGTRDCDFGLPMDFGKRKISQTDAKKLIAGEITTPREYIWKDGSKSTTGLVLKDFKISFPDAEQMREEVGVCPLCKGRVYKGKGYYCENAIKKEEPKCKFFLGAKIGKTSVPSTLMRQILKNGETTNPVKITWPSGKKLEKKLTLGTYNNGFCFTTKDFEPIEICRCPNCNKGTVTETDFYYICSNFDHGCDIKLPKSVAQSKITHEDVLLVLNGGETNSKLFTSKKEDKVEKFSASLALDRVDGKTRFKFIYHKN